MDEIEESKEQLNNRTSEQIDGEAKSTDSKKSLGNIGLILLTTSLALIVVVVAWWYTSVHDDSNNASNEPTPTMNVSTPIPTDIQDDSIDTSNWQTYTNEEYGYSIMYPESWSKTNADGEMVDESVLSRAKIVRFINTDEDVLTIISVREVSGDTTVEEYLNNSIGYQIDEQEYERVSINGKTIIKYTVIEKLDTKGLNSSAYYKSSPEHIVSISTFYQNENEEMKAIFESIVKSIRTGH